MGRDMREGEVIEELTRNGWQVLTKGFPDLLCYRGGAVIAIEVKSLAYRRLTKNQLTVLRWLSQAGVICYKWTPAGLEKIDANYKEPPKGKTGGPRLTEEEIKRRRQEFYDHASPEIKAKIDKRVAAGLPWY